MEPTSCDGVGVANRMYLAVHHVYQSNGLTTGLVRRRAHPDGTVNKHVHLRRMKQTVSV